MQVPIACSLNPASARNQAGEWRDLLARASAGVERTSVTELSVPLVDDPELLTKVVSLAQREKVCCPFFDFTVRIEADTLTLLVQVPADASAVLDELAPSPPTQATG